MKKPITKKGKGLKFLDEKMNVHNISADEVDSSFRKGNFMQTISFIKSVDNNIKPEFPAADLDDACKTMEFMELYEKYKNK